MSASMPQFHVNFQADLYLYIKMMILAKAFPLLMLQLYMRHCATNLNKEPGN